MSDIIKAAARGVVMALRTGLRSYGARVSPRRAHEGHYCITVNVPQGPGRIGYPVVLLVEVHGEHVCVHYPTLHMLWKSPTLLCFMTEPEIERMQGEEPDLDVPLSDPDCFEKAVRAVATFLDMLSTVSTTGVKV